MYETSRRDPLPIRVPAATAILTAAEFDDLPFGGWAGERIIPAKYEPAPPPPEPLRIEPPEWAGQQCDPTLADRDPEQLPDALAVLKAEADDVY